MTTKGTTYPHVERGLISPDDVFWQSDPRCFSWPLAPGVTAELRVTGADKITQAHLARLRQLIELAEGALD